MVQSSTISAKKKQQVNIKETKELLTNLKQLPAELSFAKTSGIVTVDAQFSFYILASLFTLSRVTNPRNLCESQLVPVSF